MHCASSPRWERGFLPTPPASARFSSPNSVTMPRFADRFATTDLAVHTSNTYGTISPHCSMKFAAIRVRGFAIDNEEYTPGVFCLAVPVFEGSEQGRPIEGALVWIEPALTTGLTKAHTDSSGTYKVAGLIDVPYTAKAWTEVDYGGEHFCLRLGMPNASDFDSFVPSDGAVRNFQWQLTGVIEDLKDYDGYFGGEIRLFREGDMKNGTVELTFTPQGPLVDGSTVAAFTRTLNVNEDLFVYDIPLGLYTVTSVLVEADGTRTPLKTGATSASDGYATQTDAADLAFKPDGCGNGSGLERAFLYLNSPYEY